MWILIRVEPHGLTIGCVIGTLCVISKYSPDYKFIKFAQDIGLKINGQISDPKIMIFNTYVCN